MSKVNATINTYSFYKGVKYLSDTVIKASGGGTSFYGEDLPKLISPVYDPNTKSSYIPQGLQVHYDEGESISYVNYTSSNVNVYLKGYSTLIPTNLGSNSYVWDNPSDTLNLKLQTLDGKFQEGTLSVSEIVKPSDTWDNLIGSKGGFSWRAKDKSDLKIQIYPTAGPTLNKFLKDKPINVGTILNPVSDRIIDVDYNILYNYPPNITVPALEYRLKTYDNTFNAKVGSDYGITIPQIIPIENPDTLNKTNMASIWNITCPAGSPTNTVCQVSNTLIPGKWWTTEALVEKKDLIKMLKMSTNDDILEMTSNPGNYLVCPKTNGDLFTKSENYLYAKDQKYFRGWFSGQYIGAYRLTKAFEPDINKLTYFDYRLQFKINKDIIGNLFKIEKKEKESDITLLNLKNLEALPLLNTNTSIAGSINKLLQDGTDDLPKLGVYSSSLLLIEKASSLLESSDADSNTITNISITGNNLVINYKGGGDTPVISGDTYNFTYRAFMLPDDYNFIKDKFETINSNVYNDMNSNIKKYGLQSNINILNTIVKKNDNIYKGELTNPFEIKDYYTSVTLTTKSSENITSSTPVTDRCDKENINVNHIYGTTPEFAKNNIFNVTLPSFDQPISGDVSYGDVYSYVDKWMRNISSTYKSSPKSSPVNVCNMQFYNQPSPSKCGSNDCNYTTCSSLYSCPGFSGGDSCEASGPSGLVMYNTYMKGYNIELAVGKPIIPESAPARGFVDIPTLLNWSNKNGKKVYPSSDGGAIMTWVVGTESSITNVSGFKSIIPSKDLITNKIKLYQYFDSFGPQSSGGPATMATYLQEFFNEYNKGDQYLTPIFAFCDIGSDDSFGDITIPWGGNSEGDPWWTQDKIKIVQTNKDKYDLPDLQPSYIASPNQVPVLVNGGAGQWASSNDIISVIGTPGKRTNSDTKRCIISFGGQLVPMANLHTWDVEKVAQNLVNIVVKYGFDGIDFDLEGYDNSINGQIDIIWTANLYGNVKRYFLNYEKLINTEDGQQLGYPKDYTFWITDAPQPGYFRTIYWNAQAKTSDMPPSTKGDCVCAMECPT